MSRTCFVSIGKVRDYLLNPDHPDGGPKSAFFHAHGFERSKHERLADALVQHFDDNPVAEIITTPYGTKSIVRGPLRAPDGRTPNIKSVWIRSPGYPFPTLVTAVPDRLSTAGDSPP